MYTHYKVNPDYTPKQGDYLSAEDWTDDEIKWLVNNTPDKWWFDVYLRKRTGFNNKSHLKMLNGDYFGTNSPLVYGCGRRITPEVLLIDTSPLLQPSPVPRKMLVADCSNDTYDMIRGVLTHNRPHQIIKDHKGTETCGVLCDDEVIHYFSKTWFKEVLLYDEDEDELICRDIEFEEGEYIDLRKHTPDQIRHIAKFYPVYRLEETLGTSKWEYLRYDRDEEFAAAREWHDSRGKEYTYDDIFYKE
jgi:hypothetical protein